MIRGAKYIQEYPNRSVIEDLLKRTGNPDENSFTPFTGKASTIPQQFGGKLIDKFNIDDMVDYIVRTNMDLDPTRINHNVSYHGIEFNDKESAGYTVLEDMVDNESDVDKWLSQAYVAYKKNGNSPFVAEKEVFTNFVYDDDGEAEDEKNFLVEKSDSDKDTFYRIIDEIPYLLKLIHNKSKAMNAHLFSFTRAYALIKRKFGTVDVQPKEFGNYTLYRLDSMGRFDREFVHEKDNRSTDYRSALAFIRGGNPHDRAYKACMKLITSLEAIGVNIEFEDPRQYSNDFINRLQCNYLESNSEYYENYKEVDAELIAALSPENIFKVSLLTHDYEDEDYDTREDIVSYIKTNLSIAATGPAPNGIDWDVDRSEEVLTYLKALKIANDRLDKKQPTPFTLMNGLEFIDGLLYYKKSILVLSGKFCGRFIGQYKGTWPEVVLSNYGMAIVLPKIYEGVYYQPIGECVKRATAKLRGEFDGGGWNVL